MIYQPRWVLRGSKRSGQDREIADRLNSSSQEKKKKSEEWHREKETSKNWYAVNGIGAHCPKGNGVPHYPGSFIFSKKDPVSWDRRTPSSTKRNVRATILCLICFGIHGLAAGISSGHSSSLRESLPVISGHPLTSLSLKDENPLDMARLLL